MAGNLRSFVGKAARRLGLLGDGSSPSEPVSEAELILQSSLFDEIWYRERNLVQLPEALAAIEDYIVKCRRGHIQPHPLFDQAFYLKQLAERNLPATDLSPLGHFIQIGANQGLRPNKLFDADYYRAQLTEPLPGYQAFRHFLTTSGALSPHPAFDCQFYRSQRGDLKDVNPLTHFVECGWIQGLNPRADFSVLTVLQDSSVRFNGLNGVIDRMLETGPSS